MSDIIEEGNEVREQLDDLMMFCFQYNYGWQKNVAVGAISLITRMQYRIQELERLVGSIEPERR